MPVEPPNGFKVLVVDDDEVNRFVTVERVRRLGYDVSTAANGEQAVAQVARESFAAVLMDCQMPVLDGYQATQRIRAAEPPGVRLPIIALTAHVAPGEREKVLAAGMDDYLTKPIRAEALRRALDHYAKGRAESSRPLPPLELDVLQELSGGTPRSHKVIELFLRLIPGQIEALRRAVEQADALELRAQAHKLKGSCSSIGASRMAALCQALQNQAEAGGVIGTLPAVAAIETRFAAVRELLQAELAAQEAD
jgi:CheY-like chemotaxis protein